MKDCRLQEPRIVPLPVPISKICSQKEQNCMVTGNTQMTLPSLAVLVIWEIFLSHSSALNVVAICRKEFAATSAAPCRGYRKALRLMKQAEKFHRPVICFVDTSGAYCGEEAEERGQGQAIADNLMQMMGLETPIITIVIGEGGSGGALGLSVANRVYMLENAVFSVISPEGCASILWEDASKAADAAECLKITAEDMKRFGVAEDVIEENFDSFDVMCEDLKARLLSDVQELEQYSGRVLSEKRYERFRKLGVYSEK